MEKLVKGNPAPAFALENQEGQIVKMTDYRGKKILLFFYPKANTSG
jgi:thioredoxin-dependent peroxiredoxin